MVLTDKSSKSLKDCMDFVYCKLRISQPVSDSNGQFRKVFNGVSVNSWFSPMGISVSPEKEQVSYSPITKNLRSKLEERAKSASAVLGRRYFEIEQQEVGKDEVLQGSSMFKANACPSTQRQNVKSASGRFCGNGCSASSGEIRSKILSQRPHTCHGTRPDKPVYEKLSISAKSLEILGCQHKMETTGSNATTVKQNKVRLLSDFKTDHQMRDAFYQRVKSAPPSIQHVQVNTDCETNKGNIPLYWKTKSIYHRKQFAATTGCDTEENLETASRGSLWKPLLYSNDGGIKHKAGCPYKCKGCFRACLVSQDYMDKLLSGEIQLQQNRKRSVKPKFYHRKIVEYAIANAQPIKELIENEKQARVKKTQQDREPVNPE